MSQPTWPALPLAAWQDTYDTLHMWTQVVGKICLALTPPTNHFWNVAFRVTPRGLVTPVMPYSPRADTAAARAPALDEASGAFWILFDFVDHALVVQRSDGAVRSLALQPCTVADFYRETMQLVGSLGIDPRIWPVPVEVAAPIPFEQDSTHRSYDADAVHRFWRILLATQRVLEAFRGGFVGKCSPVHFFWGSFDLAVTRFSGRVAPPRAGADLITREAYSHEVISHGFWPGGGAAPEAAFYAYAAPEPEGLKTAMVRPDDAFYSQDLSEFLLPYEAVRTASDPEATLTQFLESTYRAAADLALWDRQGLERRAAEA
ncbi:MAG TPA: DUF5996 family protein [Vicinamibacterales bacterium]|nr:DUF5996 family protein [Vicinamibacterales bacterium]